LVECRNVKGYAELLSKLEGNPNIYALQNPLPIEKPWASNIPLYGERTQEILKDQVEDIASLNRIVVWNHLLKLHMTGKITLGIHLMLPDGIKTMFGAIDIDRHHRFRGKLYPLNPEDVKTAHSMFLKVLINDLDFSPSYILSEDSVGGYHDWFLFDTGDGVFAVVFRAIMVHACNEFIKRFKEEYKDSIRDFLNPIGKLMLTPEIFPVQNDTRFLDQKAGSLIRLPGKHQRKNGYSTFENLWGRKISDITYFKEIPLGFMQVLTKTNKKINKNLRRFANEIALQRNKNIAKAANFRNRNTTKHPLWNCFKLEKFQFELFGFRGYERGVKMFTHLKNCNWSDEEIHEYIKSIARQQGWQYRKGQTNTILKCMNKLRILDDDTCIEQVFLGHPTCATLAKKVDQVCIGPANCHRKLKSWIQDINQFWKKINKEHGQTKAEKIIKIIEAEGRDQAWIGVPQKNNQLWLELVDQLGWLGAKNFIEKSYILRSKMNEFSGLDFHTDDLTPCVLNVPPILTKEKWQQHVYLYISEIRFMGFTKGQAYQLLLYYNKMLLSSGFREFNDGFLEKVVEFVYSTEKPLIPSCLWIKNEGFCIRDKDIHWSQTQHCDFSYPAFCILEKRKARLRMNSIALSRQPVEIYG